jgi:hypothetical protein
VSDEFIVAGIPTYIISQPSQPPPTFPLVSGMDICSFRLLGFGCPLQLVRSCGITIPHSRKIFNALILVFLGKNRTAIHYLLVQCG